MIESTSLIGIRFQDVPSVRELGRQVALEMRERNLPVVQGFDEAGAEATDTAADDPAIDVV